jgi:tetratricopeptide (TPR) repeat protein
VAYWTGVAFDGLGDRAKAIEAWTKAAAPVEPATGRRGGQMAPGPGTADGGSQAYFRALALQKLGQNDLAKTLFQRLVESGKNALEQPAPVAASDGGGRGGRAQPARIRSANAHYLEGLGYLGLNEPARAKAELNQAVDLSPDLLGARSALASIK